MRTPLMGIPVAELPLTVRRDVLKELAAGRTRQWAAEKFGLSADQVSLIGSKHGYPNQGAMARALAVLERRISEGDDELAAAIDSATAPSASLPEKPQLPAAREFRRVPVASLVADPDNPRTNVEEDLDDLKRSIREAGLIQAPVVRPLPDGRLMIVAGHRRVAAVRQLGWPSIEVVVNRAIRPDSVLAAMLIENGQRRDLDPIEEARALAKIQALLGGPTGGGSQLAVAKKVGRSLAHVSSRLTLLSLRPEDQEQLRTGHMSLTEATAKARIMSGRVRPGATGRPGPGHLSSAHPLAGRAKARCIRMGHSRGKGVGVGGVACGECWETVIRADERSTLQTSAQVHRKCPLCDAPTTVGVGPLP